jgi:hypothetical protein
MSKLNGLCVVFIFLVLASGCATLVVKQYDQMFGVPQAINRQVESLPEEHVDYWDEVQPILESRCVSCHACYDAPCQLKITAIEGIDRGAINEKVYNATRLLHAKPSRLFEDNNATQGWRDDGFFPVLNEYSQQSPAVNLQASLLYRFLDLKKQHPNPVSKTLPEDISLGLDRAEQCTDINGFDSFAKKKPLWGMPYGLPEISYDEHNTIKKWIEQGATYTARPKLSAKFADRVQEWESYLNQDSLKGQLVSRYIYEHLYLANLYFDDVSNRQFFNIVRSATPPGMPVKHIATRRPYNDPKVERVYYRIVRHLETIVAKTHKPYALSAQRRATWDKLFFDTDYQVTRLPSYESKVAGNPFVSFEQLPMSSRYRFLLDEAQFTIMNFVKGPVCRGQVAINVIRDRFWVFFLDPDLPIEDKIEDAIIHSQDDLELASTQEDIYLPLTNWKKYADKERRARQSRDKFLTDNFVEGDFKIDLNNIWDGDGTNQNAALTIMRHFDYGTVEKGLLGNTPQTAWVIGYPLLERIHYLLVAGYDVYGNVGHQLLSRIHMDFLRMDGESTFLVMLPQESRVKERNEWHRNAPKEANEFLANPEFEKRATINIPYQTNDHKNELFAMLKERLAPVLASNFDIDFDKDTELATSVKRLNQFEGEPASLLPDTVVVRLFDQQGQNQYITIVKDVAHKNMSSMFGEDNRIEPEHTKITVLKGIVGSYPKAIYRVPIAEVGVFVDKVVSIQSEADYAALIDLYGVRRTEPTFWQENDAMHWAAQRQNPMEYGIYDLNRYENR